MLTNKLDEIVLKTADYVNESFADIQIYHYEEYLNNMYHYTLNSYEQLMEASRKLSFLDKNELVDLFAELASDEEKHYLLAELDLKAIEKKPSAVAPESVRKIHQFWSGIRQENAICYLGIMYLFENIAQHLDLSLLNDMLMRLQLGKNKTRFIVTHLHEDARHGSLILSACEKITKEEHQKDIIDASQQAADLWLNMHIFSKVAV